MNPASLHDMKHSIVRAVQDYVDIEAEELIEVHAKLPWDCLYVHCIPRFDFAQHGTLTHDQGLAM